MSKAAKSVRPAKRDVIVIDDGESANEQPVEKSAKREEEVVPSAKVVELQQEVIKLKDMFQRACRAARTAELRAEAAETRLDSKYGIKEAFESESARADDLEKRLAEVSSLLDEAIGRADNIFNENAELVRENKELKMELIEMRRSNGPKHGDSINNDQQKSVNYMTNGLAEERLSAKEARERYRTKIDELKQKLAHNEDLLKEEQRNGREDRARYRESEDCLTGQLEKEKGRAKEDRSRYRERVASLTDQLEEEKRRANEDRSRYRTRIDELTEKIDRMEEKRTSDDRARYQERIVELEQKLARREDRIEEEKRSAKEDRARYRSRIDELTHKLDHYETTHQQQQQLPVEDRIEEEKRAAKEDRARYRSRIEELTRKLDQYEKRPERVNNEPSINIYEPCGQDVKELILYEHAREKLLSVVMELEGKSLEKKLKRGFARSPQTQSQVLHCESCEKKLTTRIAIIQHFLSNKHRNKIRAKGIAVSRAAIEYWISKLKPDAQSMQQTGDAAVSDLQQVAATAACLEASEASKEIQMEEGEIDD